MIKSKELSDPNSCLNTAADDEPLFVLKGRDRHAPALVTLWAMLRESEGEPPMVTFEARECAAMMVSNRTKRTGRAAVDGPKETAAVLRRIREMLNEMKL